MKLDSKVRSELRLAADGNLSELPLARARFDAYMQELEAGDDSPEDVEGILRGFIWSEIEDIEE